MQENKCSIKRYWEEAKEGIVMKEKKKRSIGVRNVHQRIKMICGEQYGIRIRSEVYRGSVFEIYLPMR